MLTEVMGIFSAEFAMLCSLLRLSCRKTVERISVCSVTEKLMEHGIHCLPCTYANDVIDVLP